MSIPKIARAISQAESVDETTTRRIIEAALQSIMDMVNESGRCQLRGFGTFAIKTVAPRMARNMVSGEPMQLPAVERLTFRTPPARRKPAK